MTNIHHNPVTKVNRSDTEAHLCFHENEMLLQFTVSFDR